MHDIIIVCLLSSQPIKVRSHLAVTQASVSIKSQFSKEENNNQKRIRNLNQKLFVHSVRHTLIYKMVRPMLRTDFE